MKFSVITVVYNGAKTIEQTIKSVISQDNVEVEYIIIDGNSTDGTTDIIKKYEDKLYFWISEKDNGIYDAMNKGIKVATGDVISFINSDDWYEPQVFSKIESEFQNEDSILYGCVNKIVDEVKSGFIGAENGNEPQNLYMNNIYCHQGLFIKRHVFNQIGLFDLQYKVLADYEWNLRAITKGYSIRWIPLVVSNFRIGGISSSNNNYEEYYIIRKKYNKHNEANMALIEEHFYNSQRKDFFENRNKLSVYKKIKNQKIYIWGTGKVSSYLSDIFMRNGIDIYCYVDSDVNKKIASDTIAIKNTLEESEILDNNITVIIATTKYEDEIKNVLSGLGISVNRYCTYTELLEWNYHYVSDHS